MSGKQCRPWSDGGILQLVICVCTDCSSLSVAILLFNTVMRGGGGGGGGSMTD